MPNDCGSCQHFVKWKNDRLGGGLCEENDSRTKSDHGHNCKEWKGIKYARKPGAERARINKEINSYIEQ